MGSTAEATLRTVWPSRLTRYLWKFHAGAWPLRWASAANSGFTTRPPPGLKLDLANIGNFTPKVFSQNSAIAAPLGAHGATPAGAARRGVQLEREGAVQRPEANEGGREEEETGLRISLRESERLHGTKQLSFNEAASPARSPAESLDQIIGKPMNSWSPALRKGSARVAWVAKTGNDIGF